MSQLRPLRACYDAPSDKRFGHIVVVLIVGADKDKLRVTHPILGLVDVEMGLQVSQEGLMAFMELLDLVRRSREWWKDHRGRLVSERHRGAHPANERHETDEILLREA